MLILKLKIEFLILSPSFHRSLERASLLYKFWQYSHQLQNQPSYYFSFNATLIIPTLFFFVRLTHALS